MEQQPMVREDGGTDCGYRVALWLARDGVVANGGVVELLVYCGVCTLWVAGVWWKCMIKIGKEWWHYE